MKTKKTIELPQDVLYFQVRPYAKCELAAMYFPASPNDAAAVANLRNLIKRNTDFSFFHYSFFHLPAIDTPAVHLPTGQRFTYPTEQRFTYPTGLRFTYQLNSGSLTLLNSGSLTQLDCCRGHHQTITPEKNKKSAQ